MQAINTLHFNIWGNELKTVSFQYFQCHRLIIENGARPIHFEGKSTHMTMARIEPQYSPAGNKTGIPKMFPGLQEIATLKYLVFTENPIDSRADLFRLDNAAVCFFTISHLPSLISMYGNWMAALSRSPLFPEWLAGPPGVGRCYPWNGAFSISL